MNKPLLLLVLSTLFLATAQAEVYKWVDKDGNVHFGDRPTSAAPATVVKNQPTNTSSTTSSAKADTWQEDYQAAKEEKASKQKEQQAKKQKITAICNELKSQLAGYQQTGRIFTMSPTGERIYQSSEDIDTTRANLKNAIKKNCR